MDVFQLHIEINQRLQEVASFKRNKYYPEEIDLALNKAQYRLLEKGVETNFQAGQINLSTVSALIQRNKNFDLILPSQSDPLYEAPLLNSYTPIPPDLYWTINVRAEIVTDPYNCEQAPDLGKTELKEYVALIGYPQATGTTPFYKSLAITGFNNTTNLYTVPPEIDNGVATIQGKYFITQHILESYYRNNTIKIYWERYRDVYEKGKFFIVSNSPLPLPINIIATGYTPSTATNTTSVYSIYNKNLIDQLPRKKVQIGAARIEQQDNIYESLFQNKFYGTNSTEPLVSQNLDYFVIYRDKSFIVSRLMVDYIRKPRTISLSLNQTSELADTTHPKLIDLAVEILRLDTKDNAYQASVQDTELRS